VQIYGIILYVPSFLEKNADSPPEKVVRHHRKTGYLEIKAILTVDR
jgi:hypothetical protein